MCGCLRVIQTSYFESFENQTQAVHLQMLSFRKILHQGLNAGVKFWNADQFRFLFGRRSQCHLQSMFALIVALMN